VSGAWRAVLLGIVCVFWSAPASAQAPRTITVGVFLPNAAFASNTERSVFAERVAAAIGREAGAGYSVVARAFARRADLVKFLKAKKLDLLVADPLFQVGSRGTVLAHAVDDDGQVGPAIALYAPKGTGRLEALRGKSVAVTASGAADLRFYVASLLRGEVDPRSFFGPIREAKDAGAGVGAVQTGAAGAAFAPAGLAAAGGLEVVLEGGVLPLAVLVGELDGAAGKLPEELTGAAVRALTLGGGAGGGIRGWRPGDGGALEAARADRIAVTAEKPLLAPTTDADVAPPRVRLDAETRVPPATVKGIALPPTLPEATP
jgi:hypothetical protein